MPVCGCAALGAMSDMYAALMQLNKGTGSAVVDPKKADRQ